MLEHYKGRLPLWLSPLQAKVLTITDEQMPYAQTVLQALQKAGLRAQLDQSSDPIQAKIKDAQLAQVPWMIVLGPKEAQNKTVTLRHRDGKQEFGISLEELLKKAKTTP